MLGHDPISKTIRRMFGGRFGLKILEGPTGMDLLTTHVCLTSLKGSNGMNFLAMFPSVSTRKIIWPFQGLLLLGLGFRV